MGVKVFGKTLSFKRKKKRSKLKEYETLGRQLESMYDAVNPDRKALYRTAFLLGVVRGLGAVVGATVVIAMLVWLLTLVGHVPLIGPFIETVRETLQGPRQ